MRENWDLLLAVVVYTVTIFWFGLWCQKKSDQRQLKRFTDTAWTKGCNRCAQFEKDKCERDQLQGVPVHDR